LLLCYSRLTWPYIGSTLSLSLSLVIGIEKISRNDEEVEFVGRHELSAIIGDPLLSKMPFFFKELFFF